MNKNKNEDGFPRLFLREYSYNSDLGLKRTCWNF